MVNRINIFQPDAPMSYDDRIKILKERKLEETRVKSTMKVYQDGMTMEASRLRRRTSSIAFRTMRTVPGTGMTGGARIFTS